MVFRHVTNIADDGVACWPRGVLARLETEVGVQRECRHGNHGTNRRSSGGLCEEFDQHRWNRRGGMENTPNLSEDIEVGGIEILLDFLFEPIARCNLPALPIESSSSEKDEQKGVAERSCCATLIN